MGPDTFSALLGALYRRRLTVLLVLAAAVASAWWYVSTVPPLFRARATLFLRAETPQLSLSSSLDAIPEEPVLPDSSEVARVGMLGIAASPAVYGRVLERFPEFDLPQLRKRVVLDIDPSQQMLVLAVDEDPERAVRIANEFTLAVSNLMSEMSERHPLTTLAALRREEPEARRAYLAAQDAMLTFLTAVGSADPVKDLQLLVEERQELRDALAELDLAEQRAAAQLPVVEAELAQRPGLVLARRTVFESVAVRSALDAVAATRTELAVARTRYLPGHPAVRQLEERLAVEEARVREESARGLEQEQDQFEPDPQATKLMERLVELKLAAAGTAPARADLGGRLQQVESAIQAMPLNQAELARLDQDIQVSRAHLLRVTERVAELDLQLERGLEPVFYDPDNLASVERLEEIPSAATVIGFAVLAGLFGGLALATAAELLAQARAKAPF